MSEACVPQKRRTARRLAPEANKLDFSFACSYFVRYASVARIGVASLAAAFGSPSQSCAT